MGRIGNWWRKSRARKAIRTLKQTFPQLSGNATDELIREGGWEVLAREDNFISDRQWVGTDQKWKTYSERAMEALYRFSSVIFACVKLKSAAHAQIRYVLREWKGKGWKTINDSPFYVLMRRPNKTMDRAEFFWHHTMHLELTGKSYIWKMRNKGGFIIGQYPLVSSSVTEDYNRQQKLSGYIINKGSTNEFTIPPDDIYIMRYPDPTDATRACGPLQAALRDYQIDEARADLLIEVLTNIHYAGVVVKHTDPMSPTQLEEAKRIIMEIAGKGSRGNPLFLQGKESELQVPQAPQDVDWEGTMTAVEARMCGCFGVPPILAHLRAGLAHATYSNYGEARKSMYTDGMLPLWTLTANGMERGLFGNEGDEETEVALDISEVRELQEDENSKHTRVISDYHGGLLTWDEAREAIDEQPLKGKRGKTYLRPMGMVEIDPTEPLFALPNPDQKDEEHLQDWEEEEDADDEIEEEDDEEEETIDETDEDEREEAEDE